MGFVGKKDNSTNDEKRKKSARAAFVNLRDKAENLQKIIEKANDVNDTIDLCNDLMNVLDDLLNTHGMDIPDEIKRPLHEISNYSKQYGPILSYCSLCGHIVR